MKRRLTHPFWVHAPAMASWVGFVVYSLSRSAQWPERVPVQYGLDGLPTQVGSPWFVFGLAAFLGAAFIALGVFLDELWARQEVVKRFNPMTLLDEAVVGFIVGLNVGILARGSEGGALLGFPWGHVVAIVGPAVGIAAVLEWLRPRGSSSRAVTGKDDPVFRQAVEAAGERGAAVAYWDIQNPCYVTVLSLGIPLLLWVAAGLQWSASLWTSVLLLVVGVVLVSFYGGQRTRVDRAGVSVRYGLTGIRVVRIPLDNIASAEVRSFSPLREFGGYGIRRNRTTWGYFLRGDRGVGITTVSGRDILIGSDHPERLAAAVQAMSGCERRKEGRKVE